MNELPPSRLDHLVTHAHPDVAAAVEALRAVVNDPEASKGEIADCAANTAEVLSEFDETVYDDLSRGGLQSLFELAASKIDDTY